jgi:hypothetical protein
MPQERAQASQEDLIELESLKGELNEELRALALDDLWFFATEVLWPDTAPIHYYEPLHRPVCEWVGVEEKGARKLLLMPRGHRKTYLVTIAHAVWRIVRDPDVRIILVSALDDTAQHFCQMIKRQFQYNEHFLALFPEYRVKRDQQFGRTYDFTHPLRNAHNLIDPTFRSFYLGAPVAGRRCDILIADDPIEKRHVTTPEQADKSLKDFNDLIPIVDKTGRYNMMFIVGTRWSYNDIYGAMLGEDRGNEVNPDVQVATRFESVVRHCLEDENGKPVTTPHSEGTPILPTVWSRETLLQELEQYKIDPKRGEEDWWKQYMNVCMSPAGQKFEEDYFTRTWMPRLAGGIIFSFFAVDTATKDEQILMRGDYTVVLMCHFDSAGHLYLTDGVRSDRMKGMDLIEELISMQQRCQELHGIKVSNLVKEKVGEDTFFGWVKSEFNRARLPLTTLPVTVRGQGRKYVRIVEALQHPAQALHIHFVESFPKNLHKVLVDEAIHLGQWSHDDVIDALSLSFHPDIRIKPRTNRTYEWKVPRTRTNQLSTKDNNLAALVGPMPQQRDDPNVWKPGNRPENDPYGRYGQEMPEFVVNRVYDKGEVVDVQIHPKPPGDK